MRAGAEYFLHPAGSSQRRYEALRAYFTQDMPAAEVADRFGYSTASVHQMATLLRTGRLNLFTDPKPGPKGPRKAAGELRDRVLALRAAGHSVTEIAAALTAGGLPVSAQTTWQILDAEGIGRLPRRDEGRRGPPGRLDVVKAAKLPGWPAGPVSLPCDHAGLLLLFPAMAGLGLPRLVRAAGYPSTRQLSSWQSVGSLLLAKCARTARIHHAGSLGDDAALAFTLGLTALPASAWKTVTIARAGRYRRPRLHEDMVKIKDITSKVRQIAVTGIGRDEPTLLITHDLATPARDLFARYAERMMVENELDAYISGFHLDALTSGVPLNVDLDTTLTVIAGNLYRLLALKLDRYEQATPDKIWRDFPDATGTLHIGPDGVTCALNLRSHHPVLIDAGFADLQVPIPWWHGRTLRFRFPPR